MLFSKSVLRFYKKYFLGFFFGIIFLIIVDVLQLYIPDVIGNIIDKYDANSLDYDYLIIQCCLIISIALFMGIGRFIWRLCILRSSHRIAFDLRKELFDKSLVLSSNYYKRNKVGSIMSYFTSDVDTINESFGWGTVMMIDSTFLAILAFIKMCLVSYKLSLICLIPLILLCFLAYFIDVKTGKLYDERQQAFEKMSDFTQELFVGLRVIKAFNKEVSEATRFKIVNNQNRNKDIKLSKFSGLLNSLFRFLIDTMFVIGMLIGGLVIYFAYENWGSSDLTRGGVIEFIGYLDTIIWPMIALGEIISLRARAKTSLHRINKILEEKIDVKDKENLQNIGELKGKITFKHFNYKYFDGANLALKDINLEIKPGENIGIVGKIGSGKSTLVNCLLRVDNVNEGELFLDDIDIMNIPIKDLRNNISYVPQDNYLYSKTIEENICFSSEFSEEEIIEAATFADVNNDIKDFIDGYRTLLGERGVTLSGGQKQRISIARAYIKKSPIMILDDSVNAVDVNTEKKILNNLKEKRSGKTTILVSSRVSTVIGLDKIIVLNNGEVEAFGTHEELLKISPTYNKMYYLQKLEDEIKK